MSQTNTDVQPGVHSLDERRARRALFCLERQLAAHGGLPADHHDGRVVVDSDILGAEICYHDGDGIREVARLKLRLLPGEGWQSGWLGTLVIASNCEVAFPAIVQLNGPHTGCAVWVGDQAKALMRHRDSIRFEAPALR